MPTYTYQCKKCGHEQAQFHGMTAAPKVLCEECGGRCVKLLGTGAGIIFKGSGFYETDYKDKKGSPDKSGKPDSKSESAKSESKPADSGASAPKSEPAKKTESAKKTPSASK